MPGSVGGSKRIAILLEAARACPSASSSQQLSGQTFTACFGGYFDRHAVAYCLVMPIALRYETPSDEKSGKQLAVALQCNAF